MASLRTANSRLRNYFKENYIPQVCEALLCGLLTTCPEDPLKYLQKMIITIMENGLESLLWDMCIDPSMRPKIRRLSETYMEQLFGLDDQLMTPELMIKACTFYTGRLVKTHFCSWRDIAIPLTNEDDELAEKIERAMKYNNFRLQKYAFHLWHSYVKGQKKQLTDTLSQVQKMLHCYKLTAILTKWRDKARLKYKKREDELILKHELQLLKWRNNLKLKVAANEESIFPEPSLSKVSLEGNIPECDISLLPQRAVSQIFFYLSLKDKIICSHVCHSWMLMTQASSLWNGIDFSTVKNIITDKYIVSTLQRWRLNVLRLNFRGCILRLKTLRSVSLCRNLQELNVSDCPTLTDESMRYISEGCPGVLYLNLSNTIITNRTMRLLPRHFHNLQNLSLAYCKKFTDKGLRYLNLGDGCHKLIYLDLSGCTQISVQGFRNIANSCTGIMHLTINDMPTLTDNCIKGLMTLSRHKKLKELSLSECYKITDVGIQAFCKGSLILEHLDVSYCSQLSNEIIKALAIYCVSLTSLSIAGCPKITDSAIEMLSAKCHYLHILDISGCVLLTDQMLEDLQIGCKQLRILKMQYCRLISMEAAKRMSSIVQQQEYNPGDPPLWFGYDYEGKPLTRQHEIPPPKNVEWTVTESTHSSQDEVV
ncbi:dynein regulatory complex subunit 6 isoform X5 [Prionailurus viverrinus]|uniref:dynein regulatory complex subunit 6 isoform X5 n=1 Tax=Prionailurus viverrinus TaxID=61388 RepID=UPI001FF58F13|nr:dynein regulatory complex subunit 6 isoform X5 [Prionailurus viverrinus]